MTIASLSASLVVESQPRFQRTVTFEQPNPKRVPVYKTSTTNSDGSREVTIYYSDRTNETRTERPVKASVSIKITPASGGILV